MIRGFPFLLAPGCVILGGNTVGDCEDVGVTASGSVSFAGEARDATSDRVDVATDAGGTCVTSVTTTLELGEGCSLYVRADGGTERLPIFDVSLSGEEGCGLAGAGWTVVDFGDSAVVVTGSLEPTDSENTFCHEGTVTVELDLVAEGLDGDSAEIVGEVVFEGVSYADVESAACG